MKFVLQRVNLSSTVPTTGVLLLNGTPVCATLERPWQENKNAVSCIPPGTYAASKFKSPSKGSVLLLKNVPNRAMIEMHAGNFVTDTEGCILVGFEIAGNTILKSRPALAHVLSLAGDECEIEIINPPQP